ncbi:MAG: aconitate hydratase, partial [Hydrogenophaga sp.]
LMLPAGPDGSRREGGYTLFEGLGEEVSIFDAAQRYMAEGKPTVIFAGEEYGTGSSRDWAAKGTRLLGIRAVVARSFERIHRSNLVGMGVLPLQFKAGESWETLGLRGDETIDVLPHVKLLPQSKAKLVITRANGEVVETTATLRIDTPVEVSYYSAGGILPYVLRQLLGA